MTFHAERFAQFPFEQVRRIMLRGATDMKNTLVFPTPPPSSCVQPPIIYEEQKMAWEYMPVVRNLSKETAPTAEELNRWGSEGWELTGLFCDSRLVYFYFKRPARS
jgi:hypothetical protein